MVNHYYFALIFLSLVPSLIWLIFFLREDRKPEPAKKIIKVFFWGMIVAIPVILIAWPLNILLEKTSLSFFAIQLIMIVGVAAVVEEIAKFFVIKQSVLKSPECDEPIDLMIYAITIALGFAALENIVLLLPLELPFSNEALFIKSFLRFISGTFLHALVGGIMGYFIALSILHSKKKNYLIFVGVTLAIVLHALYNFSIMYSLVYDQLIIIAPVLLITLFIVVFFCFNKLKKMTSICKL